MSEMIDGYTAQKIKDFWMKEAHCSQRDDVLFLFGEIEKLKSLLAQETVRNDELARKLQEREKELAKFREKDKRSMAYEIMLTKRIATLEGILKDRDGIIADLQADLKKVVDAGYSQLIEPRRIDLKSYAARPEAGEKEKS